MNIRDGVVLALGATHLLGVSRCHGFNARGCISTVWLSARAYHTGGREVTYSEDLRDTD
jgi:hypothetical protein